MATLKCTKCSATFEDDINGIIYCPYCSEIQPLPPNLTEEQRELIYNEAVLICDRAKSIENLSEVASIFEQLDGYRDSKHQLDRCRKKLNEIRNESIYTKALASMDKESVRGYREAIELFSQIPEWRNSSFKIDEANAKLETLLEQLEKRKQLAIKISMIVSACLIALAIATYLFIEFAVPAIRYAGAKGDLEDGEFDKAYATLEDLGDYKDSADLIKKSKYERGLEYLSKGDAQNACKMFGGAIGYNDAEERQLEICKTLKIDEQISLLEVGNTVLFGRYNQDLFEGTDALEWIIVQKDGSKALLVSKKALEAAPFAGTKWSASVLRYWLNTTFMENAFSKNDKNFLIKQITTTVYQDAEGKESIDIAEDNVFVLSENEMNRFFTTDEQRCAMATDYLKTKGIYVNDANSMVHYWLRSVSPDGKIKYVNGGGAINHDGRKSTEIIAVRPAVWVEFK